MKMTTNGISARCSLKLCAVACGYGRILAMSFCRRLWASAQKGHIAMEQGRRFVGIELKESYFNSGKRTFAPPSSKNHCLYDGSDQRKTQRNQSHHCGVVVPIGSRAAMGV